MKVYKTRDGITIEENDVFYKVNAENWTALMNRTNLYQRLSKEINTLEPISDFDASAIMAPIENQEIWASGVTYKRSREARMEESKNAGGDTFYDKVYDAERPELFFKALANRTVGTNDYVNIRKDSKWDVPEPELTLWISSEGTIEGYTVGNDMSSRSIEGENPLYLPQAKVFERCAGLGPCVYVPERPIDANSLIELEIFRDGQRVFYGSIPIRNMKRKHTELVEFLFRECDFQHGCYLMTGTGIVPPDDFTLKPHDEIKITIENIGTLVNTVVYKP
ncbi:fumarylacetoacetate hydrolase family protein [Flagellimonas pacifica]|uniref:2-dehydro-3-deoxy-D-arabinonate dehydratase n=1 Tax=Flagellimonas pacifica TaxID=1247520 RepID=A0A285MUQ9_9FLAO|nr:fumarylacetoacetate hydrolase family protein [Allomuricauda parva]SNZ00433.1 2-dehydro-3-deoxy-D-arabinonate dehydratase [Allomuricauda parva]